MSDKLTPALPPVPLIATTKQQASRAETQLGGSSNMVTLLRALVAPVSQPSYMANGGTMYLADGGSVYDEPSFDTPASWYAQQAASVLDNALAPVDYQPGGTGYAAPMQDSSASAVASLPPPAMPAPPPAPVYTPPPVFGTATAQASLPPPTMPAPVGFPATAPSPYTQPFTGGNVDNRSQLQKVLDSLKGAVSSVPIKGPLTVTPGGVSQTQGPTLAQAYTAAATPVAPSLDPYLGAAHDALGNVISSGLEHGLATGGTGFGPATALIPHAVDRFIGNQASTFANPLPQNTSPLAIAASVPALWQTADFLAPAAKAAVGSYAENALRAGTGIVPEGAVQRTVAPAGRLNSVPIPGSEVPKAVSVEDFLGLSPKSEAETAGLRYAGAPTTPTGGNVSAMSNEELKAALVRTEGMLGRMDQSSAINPQQGFLEEFYNSLDNELASRMRAGTFVDPFAAEHAAQDAAGRSYNPINRVPTAEVAPPTPRLGTQGAGIPRGISPTEGEGIMQTAGAADLKNVRKGPSPSTAVPEASPAGLTDAASSPPAGGPSSGAAAGGEAPKDFAANIRLSKYPEDVRGPIAQWAAEHPEDVQAARRGIQSDADVKAAGQALAEDVGADFSKLQKKWKPGEAWNAEEITAIRGVLNDRTQNVLDAAKAAAGGDVNAQAQLMLAIEEQARVQQIVHGVTAEAGRSLRAFKADVSEGLANQDIARLRQLLDQAGKSGKLAEASEYLSKMDLNNPVAINNFLRQMDKPKSWDYLHEMWINSILSSPKTHMINTISNTLATLSAPAERGLAAAAETVVAPLQGRPRQRFFGEVGADVYGAARGLPDAFKAAFATMRDGVSASSASKIDLRPQAFKGKLGSIIRAPGTALEMMDSFFYTLNYRASLNASIYRQAMSEGHRGEQLAARMAELTQNPSYNLIKSARDTADYRVFRNPSKIADALGTVRKVIPGMNFVMPFIKTPVNILSYGLERSPLAAADLRATGPWQQLLKGSPEASDKLGRLALGSIVAGAVAYQFGQGKITGAAPTSAAERDRFYREGKLPYSVKIGGKWVQYQRLEPFNQPLTQVAGAIDAMQNKDATTEQKVMGVLTTVADNLANQSYLTGINDLLTAVEDPGGRNSANLLTHTATGFMPFSGLSRLVTQAMDPTVRKPETLTEAFQSQIPGESQKVPPRLDALGNEVQRQSPAWSPIQVTPSTQSRLDAELGRLGVEVGFTGDSIGNFPLNREWQQVYQKAAGQATSQYANQLLDDPSYNSLPDDVKARALENLIGKVRDVTRKEVLAEMDKQGQLVPAGAR